MAHRRSSRRGPLVSDPGNDLTLRGRSFRHGKPQGIEALESRFLLSTITVTDLADTGAPNTLRWAIDTANNSPGLDIIQFSKGGTIKLASSLPTITDTIQITSTTSTKIT